MRQIMQAMVALAVLMSSTATVSAMVTGGNEANDSVSAKAQKAAAEIVAARKITGTVYDAATKEPLPGVRVQGTGHSNVTTMTNPEGKFTLNVPSYVTLLNFSTPGYALVQRPVQNNDVIDVVIKFKLPQSHTFSLLFLPRNPVGLTKRIMIKIENSIASV